MKVSALIRQTAKKNNVDYKATVYFRIRDGKKDIKAASELMICPNHWNAEKQGYKDRVSMVSESDKMEFNHKVHELTQRIEKEYKADADSEWLGEIIERFHHPERYKAAADDPVEETAPMTFFELFDEFLRLHHLSDVRKKNFYVVKRALMRYELFVKKKKRGMRDFVLDIEKVTKDTLADMWDFMENEYLYAERYPDIYADIPEKRTPQPRGKNTLIDCFSRIRTFFIWCYNQGLTTNRPFDKFPIEECLYGTPIYISLQERNQLFEADLSARPKLAIQRDIFVFQSVVGCRVGDLYKLTKDNIVNGALEYIQQKTRNHNPRTIRVPLNSTAKKILERYADYEGEHLLPFVSEQKYNQAIKEAFKLAGLDRLVTMLNPLTRQPEQHHLYEVATTHTARKTFIGNIYKQVKDPDLVSSLSGHKEGSRAFRRYREIDEEMKKDLVHLLD
ncbi:MAG: site-specific integrase [Prevotella sp.]|nr:site-specific integrase [Prevotella sp.]